ncbi:MAG: hypothetical protein JNL90_18485 [Planctomycetes bacterium]|nr:hypothetical protein [Planctomycetota bacterium]
MRELALSIDGAAGRLPPLEEVAGWLEALGLRAWVPGVATLAPPAERMRRDLPGVRCPAIRHPLLHAGATVGIPRSLFAAEPSVAAAAVADLAGSLAVAAALRARFTIVELADPDLRPGGAAISPTERDQKLERLCRALHEATRERPEQGLALALPRARVEWLTPGSVADVLDDLGRRRQVAWWHDSGRAAAWAHGGGVAAPQWLDRLAGRCVGLDATDAVDGHSGLPAGSGAIDLKAVIGALSADCTLVVRSEPFLGPGPLLAAVRHLRGERP